MEKGKNKGNKGKKGRRQRVREKGKKEESRV